MEAEGTPQHVRTAVQGVAANSYERIRGLDLPEQRVFWIHIRELAGHHITVIDLMGDAAGVAVALVIAHSVLESMGLAW